MKLEKGMLIKTSYDTGPYRIVGITRGCTCPLYLDEKPTPPHVHIEATKPDGKGNYYLNYFVEGTLTHVPETRKGYDKEKEPDRIIILEQDIPVQRSFL